MKIYYETGDIRHSTRYGSTYERPGHKYFKKIPIGNGKYRYFYSEKEWIRYYNVNTNIKLKNDREHPNMNVFKRAAKDVTDTEKSIALRESLSKPFTPEGNREIKERINDSSLYKKGKVAKTALKNMIYNIKTELKKKKQTAGMSKEYLEELEYNSKKNNYPKKKK